MSLMRARYRVLVVVLLAVGFVTAGLLVASGRASSASSFGMSSIPGMSQVGTGSPVLCGGNKGMVPADYCSWAAPTASIAQGWVLASAIDRYGALNAGLSLPLPLSFAQQNAGPAEVFDRVVNFSTQDEANKLLNDPEYTGAANSDYTPLPTAAIDNGLAGRVDSPANDGLTEYRFNWVSGTSEVDVNVVGANLTVSEALAVAKLALPNQSDNRKRNSGRVAEKCRDSPVGSI